MLTPSVEFGSQADKGTWGVCLTLGKWWRVDALPWGSRLFVYVQLEVVVVPQEAAPGLVNGVVLVITLGHEDLRRG